MEKQTAFLDIPAELLSYEKVANNNYFGVEVDDDGVFLFLSQNKEDRTPLVYAPWTEYLLSIKKSAEDDISLMAQNLLDIMVVQHGSTNSPETSIP